jgi:Domain of unknown function (DUF4340)
MVEAAVSRVARPSRVAVVWLVLAVLLGAILVIEYTDLVDGRSGRASEADARRLLPLPVDALGAIEVVNAGRLHRFERDAAGSWFYHGAHTGAESGSHEHAADPAQSQRIGAAFAALGRARVEREFPRPAEAKDYGVTTPQILILLYRPKEPQPLAQYAVGDVAPDTVSRYVERVGSARVVTIPAYQVDNLLSLLAVVEPSARR